MSYLIIDSYIIDINKVSAIKCSIDCIYFYVQGETVRIMFDTDYACKKTYEKIKKYISKKEINIDLTNRVREFNIQYKKKIEKETIEQIERENKKKATKNGLSIFKTEKLEGALSK